MEFSLRLSSSLMFVPAVIQENALVTIVSTRVFLEYCKSAKGLSGSSTHSAKPLANVSSTRLKSSLKRRNAPLAALMIRAYSYAIIT